MIDFNELLEDLEEQELNNMSNENNNGQTEMDVWTDGSLDDEEGNEYLKFTAENNNTVKYKMLVDKPKSAPNKFGTMQHDFEVMNLDNKTVVTHSITSKRYMRDLRDYTPVSGKSFCVQRTGEELETKYHVVLIE